VNTGTEETIERLVAHKTGELTSLMTHLGIRLGLFEAMQGGETVDVDRLASATVLHRRWVLEWLRQQTGAGILEFVDEERFRIAPETADLLLNSERTDYMGWLFYPPMGGDTVDRLAEAFRTGLGMTWDEHGEVGAQMVATSTGAAHRLLASEVIPLLDDVASKLERGANAIDVGCGSGVAVAELAKAFPRSRFVGIDPSPTALESARQLAKEAALDNLELRVATAEELEEVGHYDFAMVLDCMHDMTHPRDAARAIRRVLKDDGSWLVKDVRCESTLQANLEHPMGALLYGISVCYCMSSSMSKPDGAGLGTLGFSAKVARDLSEAAGFSRFRQLDYEGDPLNAFYEIRP
jgi:SAM-dependent methyltransferase